MKEKKKPITPFQEKSLIQHAGAGVAIELSHWRDTTINPNNEMQTLYFHKLAQKIESTPLVPDSLKEKMLWMPESVREELLETWHKRRQALLKYCYDRINIRMLRKLKEEGKLQ